MCEANVAMVLLLVRDMRQDGIPDTLAPTASSTFWGLRTVPLIPKHADPSATPSVGFDHVLRLLASIELVFSLGLWVVK